MTKKHQKQTQKILEGYNIDLENKDDIDNKLDTALPDYMWDDKGREHFKHQKMRKNGVEELGKSMRKIEKEGRETVVEEPKNQE